MTHLFAIGTALAVLAGYLFSLAPSVTFWDAGEFIASMKILGIPHPPGTPLFVLLGHVWGHALPVGEFAWRTNLLSAVFSAAAAGLWFLVAHETLVRAMPGGDRSTIRLRRLGAVAAAVLIGFTFTNWQNSNETEVYGIASLIVASIAWLCFKWRAARGSSRAMRYLVLIAYLLGVSIANHLLALLAGPAVIAFLWAEQRLHPSASELERRREWAKLVVFAGLWALLLGVGLGNATLAAVGAVVFAGSTVVAIAAGVLPFALAALLVALVGVTPYLFLYLRAAQHPYINEAAPATWDALLQVIRRAQYPPRTPFDDPTELSGPDNPGRSLTLAGLQLLNYIQYFDWQWARSVAASAAGVPLRVAVTVAFFFLGLTGWRVHRRADRAGWWLVATLWLVTGLGLVAYMNFKPGFSLGYDRYPDGEDHEVRERDYFFVLSFIAWAFWAGIGLTDLVRRWSAAMRGSAGRWALAGFGVALAPPLLNFRHADRRHGADATLAGDFAYSLLNSAPPHGILFTYGDNDTFPLWWAQEVAGIRRDVRIVCLALARTEWYMRQLRDLPDRPFEEDRAPGIWRGGAPTMPAWPVHTMTDEEITAAVPQRLPRPVPLGFGPFRTTLDSGTVLYPEDFAAIRTVQQNFGRRPVVWSLTTGARFFGLDPLIVQRGIGLHLETAVPDTANPALDFSGLFAAPLDIPFTRRLALETYRYARLSEQAHGALEPTAQGIAQTMTVPLTQLALAARAREDYGAGVEYLERAARIAPSPTIQGLLDEMRQLLTAGTAPDSSAAPDR
jgi:hypothetical protein